MFSYFAVCKYTAYTADPADPTDPADPIDPTNPTNPVNPTDPTKQRLPRRQPYNSLGSSNLFCLYKDALFCS